MFFKQQKPFPQRSSARSFAGFALLHDPWHYEALPMRPILPARGVSAATKAAATSADGRGRSMDQKTGNTKDLEMIVLRQKCQEKCFLAGNERFWGGPIGPSHRYQSRQLIFLTKKTPSSSITSRARCKMPHPSASSHLQSSKTVKFSRGGSSCVLQAMQTSTIVNPKPAPKKTSFNFQPKTSTQKSPKTSLAPSQAFLPSTQPLRQGAGYSLASTFTSSAFCTAARSSCGEGALSKSEKKKTVLFCPHMFLCWKTKPSKENCKMSRKESVFLFVFRRFCSSMGCICLNFVVFACSTVDAAN